MPRLQPSGKAKFDQSKQGLRFGRVLVESAVAYIGANKLAVEHAEGMLTTRRPLSDCEVEMRRSLGQPRVRTFPYCGFPLYRASTLFAN